MSFECCSFSDLHYEGGQTLSITTYSSTSVVYILLSYKLILCINV
ncbi:unnamed protein product [Brassica oleracea]